MNKLVKATKEAVEVAKGKKKPTRTSHFVVLGATMGSFEEWLIAEQRKEKARKRKKR